MRRKLYERGAVLPPSERHELENTAPSAKKEWTPPPIVYAKPSRAEIADPRTGVLTEATVAVRAAAPVKKSWSYRSIILLITLGIFLVVLGGTSLYMLFGTNQISNHNIGIVLTGPLTLGAGETLSGQATVTNQNTVPIDSATLIVNYPSGTRSAEDGEAAVYEQRIPIDRINAGEAINVPIKAVMFGEENQEQEIKAVVEYRLVDSNGTFYKEAEPLKFKISSSPLTINVSSIEKVSAGQEIEVKLKVRSNASATLKDILVSANYPNSFDFTAATPAPVYRENEWLIKELKPEEEITISVKGFIDGLTTEKFQMQFSAGTARSDNQFILGSVLASAVADFEIEQPFIRLGLSINGQASDVAVMPIGTSPQVQLVVTNTLPESLYNMVVEIQIKGNIINREKIVVSGGYYDSVKDVIRYEVSGNSSLAQVGPGDSRSFNFSLSDIVDVATPSFSVTANAYARRVSEVSATEQLVGTVASEVKFSSTANVARQVTHSSLPFSDTGAIPPVADKKTTYTVTLEASAGANDVTGAVVTTSLPQYVTWENKTAGAGTIVFNTISKELEWKVGEIKAKERAQISFQIGLVASQNQIGNIPALMNSLSLKATDRFTGTELRAAADPVSTQLSEEAGFSADSGKVVRGEAESE